MLHGASSKLPASFLKIIGPTHLYIKGTAMQIEKTLINDRLCVSNVS